MHLEKRFQTPSLLLKPLPCVLGRGKINQPAPEFIHAVWTKLSTPYLPPFPTPLLRFGIPTDRRPLLEEGVSTALLCPYLCAGHWACSKSLASQVSRGKKIPWKQLRDVPAPAVDELYPGSVSKHLNCKGDKAASKLHTGRACSNNRVETNSYEQNTGDWGPASGTAKTHLHVW